MTYEESTDPIAEHFVAYLDGELDVNLASRIERRLADNVDDRTVCSELQKAWDLLDVLPKSHPSDAVAHSTVAMVAASAQQEVHRKGGRRPIKWFFSGLFVVAACAAGFGATRVATPDPNEALLHDLPTIESLEIYLYAEDMEYLRQLDESGLFAEEVEYAEE